MANVNQGRRSKYDDGSDWSLNANDADVLDGPDPPMSRYATSTRAPTRPGATTVTPSNGSVSSRPQTTQTPIWTQVTEVKNKESHNERKLRHLKEYNDSIKSIAAERKKEGDRLKKRSEIGSAVSAQTNQQDNDIPTPTVW
jgi:hypothetical protein